MAETEEQKWERILREAGLSVNAGANPKVISYGWNQTLTDRPTFDYTLSHKNADRRGGYRPGAGRKSQCVRHLSDRCRCRQCVKLTQKSNDTISEGSCGEM